MKKAITILFLSILLVIPSAAHADWVSSLAFNGYFDYNSNQNLFFGKHGDYVPYINGGLGDPGNDPLLEVLNNDQPYYGILAVAYQIDINLPPPDLEVPWWLEKRAWITGIHKEFEIDDCQEGLVCVCEPGRDCIGEDNITPIEHHIDFMKHIQRSAIGITEEEILAFLGTIPPSGEDIFGFDYLIDGDVNSGVLYAWTDTNVLGFDNEALYLNFQGEIRLTGHMVPEPATMLLMGSGLIGGIFVRRRRS